MTKTKKNGNNKWLKSVEIAKVMDHFENSYSEHYSKLENWQDLCEAIGVTAGPSITQCKKNLRGKYVNIFDFVAACEADQPPHVYNSRKQLQNYMDYNKRKIFPLSKAKENSILKWLLIDINL